MLMDTLITALVPSAQAQTASPPAPASASLGLAHFWEQGDALTHGVAYLLLIMSLVSWYFIISKAWSAWQLRKSRAALAQFWAAPDLPQGLKALQAQDSEGVFSAMAERAMYAAKQTPGQTLAGQLGAQDEIVTRALRQQMTQSSAGLERGLTVLASVGSTSPFVGLFGTVWGIYHALLNIAGAGQVLMDRIAGPVGEALIMTAAGLAVAIPAVLAYNTFTRINRVTLAELDGFAHDLLALVTTGRKPGA
jgi:biopolymer transport protein ExbB